MECWAQVKHWLHYSHDWAVWSGLDLHPSQPPPYPPGFQVMTTGIVSCNLLSVCPLPSLSLGTWVILWGFLWAVNGKGCFTVLKAVLDQSRNKDVLKMHTRMKRPWSTKTTGQEGGWAKEKKINFDYLHLGPIERQMNRHATRKLSHTFGLWKVKIITVSNTGHKQKGK